MEIRGSLGDVTLACEFLHKLGKHGEPRRQMLPVLHEGPEMGHDGIRTRMRVGSDDVAVEGGHLIDRMAKKRVIAPFREDGAIALTDAGVRPNRPVEVKHQAPIGDLRQLLQMAPVEEPMNEPATCEDLLGACELSVVAAPRKSERNDMAMRTDGRLL